ncbi:MAG: energy-coupling factor transporter ATPase [Calditrichaeota bacterium]|nr:energy-coupling factor transporter ATPase [Calditrichota bacterium]
MTIELENVSYAYKQLAPKAHRVLENVSFKIQDGEFVAIIGPSGAGKTTLLQQITGLLKPTAGKVYADGKNIWEKKYPRDILRRRIGLVFQFPEIQLFDETVFDDVAFGPRNLRLSEEEVENRVREALNLVGMNFDEIKNRSPHNLSGGEKRRVALAGVLAMAPQALILDEPTAGLDSAGSKRIMEILQLLNDQGVTIVMITHQLDLALQAAMRVIILVNGKIVFDGSKEEAIENPDKFQLAHLKIPAIVRLSRYLHTQGIIPDWKIFNSEKLKAQLQLAKNFKK